MAIPGAAVLEQVLRLPAALRRRQKWQAAGRQALDDISPRLVPLSLIPGKTMRLSAEAQERLRPPEEREGPEAGEEDTRQKESYIDDTVIEAYGNLLHSLQQRTRRVSDRITRVQGASMTGVFKSATDAKTRWKNWAKKATAARVHVGNIKRLRRTMEHTGLATDDMAEEADGAATELQELRRRRDEEAQTMQGYDRTMTRTREKLKKAQPAIKRLILPFTSGEHWYLVVMDCAERRITQYDALNTGSTDQADSVLRWWTRDGTEDMPDTQFSRRWTVVAEDMPRQRNGCDCGVLLSAGMRRLMLGDKRPRGAEDWGFTGADGAVIRLKMAAEIKGRQLLTLSLEEGDRDEVKMLTAW